MHSKQLFPVKGLIYFYSKCNVMNFNKIKDLAEKTNISITKLAELTGLTPAGIHQFVRNRNCKVEDLEKISRALGVSPACFWEDENKNIVNETIPAYSLSAQIEILKDQLKDKNKLIARLEKELAKYEDMT